MKVQLSRILLWIAWHLCRPLTRYGWFRPFNLVHHYALYLQGLYGRPTEQCYWT